MDCFVLDIFHHAICSLLMLHLFYICDEKEDLSILVHSLIGLNGCEWMERGGNIDFRDFFLFCFLFLFCFWFVLVNDFVPSTLHFLANFRTCLLLCDCCRSDSLFGMHFLHHLPHLYHLDHHQALPSLVALAEVFDGQVDQVIVDQRTQVHFCWRGVMSARCPTRCPSSKIP